jgi:hypothetical protein
MESPTVFLYLFFEKCSYQTVIIGSIILRTHNNSVFKIISPLLLFFFHLFLRVTLSVFYCVDHYIYAIKEKHKIIH